MLGMRKRHPALLLEMIIAFTLMGGVIAILLNGFYEAIKAKNHLKQDREKILTLQRLKTRFAALFKNVIDVKCLSDNVYYIRYKGAVDHERSFRSEVEAVLQIKNNILSLTSWPQKGGPRHEILSEGANLLKLELFDEKKGEFSKKYPSPSPRLIKITFNNEELPLFL
jgi:hypothetical protein